MDNKLTGAIGFAAAYFDIFLKKEFLDLSTWLLVSSLVILSFLTRDRKF